MTLRLQSSSVASTVAAIVLALGMSATAQAESAQSRSAAGFTSAVQVDHAPSAARLYTTGNRDRRHGPRFRGSHDRYGHGNRGHGKHYRHGRYQRDRRHYRHDRRGYRDHRYRHRGYRHTHRHGYRSGHRYGHGFGHRGGRTVYFVKERFPYGPYGRTYRGIPWCGDHYGYHRHRHGRIFGPNIAFGVNWRLDDNLWLSLFGGY